MKLWFCGWTNWGVPSPAHSTVVMMTQQPAWEEHLGSIAVPPSPSPSSYLYFAVPNVVGLVFSIASAATAAKSAASTLFVQLYKIMMTSSNGNIFCVTGHLCGEFTGPLWIPHTKASDAELWCIFICFWINREAGDLRRYRAYYGVIVMYIRNIDA